MIEEKEENHESFAQLSFNRVQCAGGETLYGSDLKHSTVIKMELKHSTKRRGLNHDWYYGRDTIAEVTMSQNQFSELITSMNMGDGIPVTLNFTENGGHLESPKFSSKLDIHENEFKDMTKRVNKEAEELLATMNELLSGSGTVKKADRDKLIKQAELVVRDIGDNMPYVEKCFKESMDKTVTDAKGTIEAFYQHRVTETGIKALADAGGMDSPKLIEQE